MHFNSLTEYRERLTPPDGLGENLIGKAFIITARPERTILLVAPKNVMEDKFFLNEDFRQALKKCSGDKSWLVVLPENTWTETDLNPYCTMSYDEGQIRIELYWTQLSTKPFIDIVTSALSCIPHQLYGWDRASRGYGLLSRKCTGTRVYENFTGTYDRFLQMND